MMPESNTIAVEAAGSVPNPDPGQGSGIKPAASSAVERRREKDRAKSYARYHANLEIARKRCRDRYTKLTSQQKEAALERRRVAYASDPNIRARRAQRYQDHRSQRDEYGRKWKLAHPGKAALYSRRWRESQDPEYAKRQAERVARAKAKADRKAYLAQHRDLIELCRRWADFRRAYLYLYDPKPRAIPRAPSQSEYRRTHPRNRRAEKQRRRARLRGSNGSFTTAEWSALCHFYEDRCLSCEAQVPLTVDHIVPLSLGGSNTIQNIQPLCMACNVAKGTQVIDFRPLLYNPT